MDETAAGIDDADMAALLAALAPRDPLEAMLASQMAAVHAAALRATKRAAECADAPQIEALYMRQAARLMHLFVRQMEALERRRVAADERAEEKAREAYFLEKEQREEEEMRRREEEHLKRWGIRPPRRLPNRAGGRGNGTARVPSEPGNGLHIPDPMPD